MTSIVATFAYTVNFNTPANGTLSVSRGGDTLTSGSIVRAGEILTVSYTGPDELILNGFEQMGDTDQYKVVARRDAPPSISFETATTPDPVDKTALETAIALAETKDESDYTPNSWSALQDALSAAQAVANDDDATTDDVTDAAATLAEAINALILRADKTALTGAIEAATAYTESEYTPESWQALTEALTAAQSVLEDDNAAPGEVTDAANAIQSAIAGLAAVAPPEEPVDKTALNEAIAAAAELAPTDYTPNSWSALQSALTTAQTVAANDDATQEQATNAANALESAINTLVPRADKTALTETIEDAAAYTESDYTPASWQVLAAALNAAQNVLANDDATPGEVADAVSAITGAIAGLVTVTPPRTPVEPDPEDPLTPVGPDPEDPLTPVEPDPEDPFTPVGPDPEDPLTPVGPDPEDPPSPPIPKQPIPNGGSGGIPALTQVPDAPAPTAPTPGVIVSKASLSYISGADRVQTSVAISRQGWTSANAVILAPGGQNNLIDALAVAPLAGQEDAPILLSTGSLDPAVVAEIQRLGAKKVYAVGALSQAVIEALEAALPGLTVETLRGTSRFETAALIGAKLTEPQGTFVVGYNAVADAVSAASYAAAHGYLIQIAGPDGTLGPAAGTPAAGAPVYILGGPALVRDIPGATRLYGTTRYETNKAIRDALPFEYANIYTADGGTLVDALTGSALAARSGAAIVLTPGNDPAGTDFGGITAETKVYAFGSAK